MEHDKPGRGKRQTDDEVVSTTKDGTELERHLHSGGDDAVPEVDATAVQAISSSTGSGSKCCRWSWRSNTG
jgi:hypothetical protein